MDAMVLMHQAPVETAPLKRKELPDPVAGEGEVVVRVSACGVCHTDVHIVEGELSPHRLPLVPGHQVVGKVEEVGPGVAGFQGGDHVGIPWLHRPCGHCRFCRSERENLCLDPLFTGWDVDGGFSERMKAHRDAVYRLPQGYSDAECAPLLCGGVIGYRAYRLSKVREGEALGIFGLGSSAHLVLQVARYEGVEVFVFTRSMRHRELARDLGAVFAGGSDDQPPRLLDAAIVFAPVGTLVKRALELSSPGARVITAGIYSTPIPELPYSLIYGERSLQSAANSTRRDVRELLSLAGEVSFQVAVETFPLHEANRALLDLKKSRLKASAVLVMHD